MTISSVLPSLFLIAGWILAPAVDGQVSDPIRDYLQMNVAERRELLDGYSMIYRATCDINGDGRNEVLIGTKYDYSGSNATYWVVYADLRSPPDEAFYEKYFGQGRKTRSLKIETLSIDELRRSGYTVPTWPPPSFLPGSVQETIQKGQSSISGKFKADKSGA